MADESKLLEEWDVTEWWAARTTLEKVGVGALAAGAAILTAVAVAPELASATVGGGLAAAGGWFLRRGFRS